MKWTSRRPATRKTGQGLKTRCVSSLRYVFFFPFSFLYTNLMVITGNEMEDREDSHEENGPKDARHVVWALGKFFF